MKNILLRCFLYFLTLGIFLSSSGQGLPPGWEFSPTPTTHIISIPLTSNPDINGYPLQPGDYIGVFYVNDVGDYVCGGAIDWTGTANTGIIAFGNDSFTPEKDGFNNGETINYRVFSWAVEKVYNAIVTCNPNLPSSCTQYVPNGLSGVATMDASGYFLMVTVVPESVCQGANVQLNAIPSGGSGNYSYQWSSIPPGFSSNLANPNAVPVVSTEYTVTVTSGSGVISRSVLVDVEIPPTVNAGNSFTICENSTASLNGSAQNALSYQWNTSGDGTFSNTTILNPVYTPGAGDIVNGSALLGLTGFPNPPCAAPATSSMILSISPLPTAVAGQDFSVCEDVTVQLSAQVSDYSSLLWTTSGDGTFNNAGTVNPIYTPGSGDLSNGTVLISVTAYPLAPCNTNAVDDVLITFIRKPQVSAGVDKTICEGSSAELAGVANYYISLLWTTSGDGTFSAPSQPVTIYFPGSGDILNGAAILTLTAAPIQPCFGNFNDQLQLLIVKNPQVNAGGDATICETNVHQVSGSATYYEETLWSTSGDGTFGDPNVLNTSYAPGPDDISSGIVSLILTAFPSFPCTLIPEDALALTIQPLPFVNAGEDFTICEDQSAQLGGSAMDFLIIQWSTSGDGTFSDINILSPIYTPGEQDIITGFAGLTLSAIPINPCLQIIDDPLMLSINHLPAVDAGQDITVENGDPAQLNGNANHFASVLWVTAGDGTFTDPTVLDPVYYPGTGDISNAGVALTLQAFPLVFCTLIAEDDLFLTIDTTTSIGKNIHLEGITIYPNPTSGSFTIDFGNQETLPVTIQIFRIDGVLVYEKLLVEGEHRVTNGYKIDIVTALHGTFLLKIFNEKKNLYQKVLIIRR